MQRTPSKPKPELKPKPKKRENAYAAWKVSRKPLKSRELVQTAPTLNRCKYICLSPLLLEKSLNN